MMTIKTTNPHRRRLGVIADITAFWGWVSTFITTPLTHVYDAAVFLYTHRGVITQIATVVSGGNVTADILPAWKLVPVFFDDPCKSFRCV